MAPVHMPVHPFRNCCEAPEMGDSLPTRRRTASEAGVALFGRLFGNHFHMHFDEIAVKESPFVRHITRGRLCCRPRPGLLVSSASGPAPAPAYDDVDALRFMKPVGIGNTIHAWLTAKRKADRSKEAAKGFGQGIVVRSRMSW